MEFDLGLQTVSYLIALVQVILALYVLLEWQRRGHLQIAVSLAILAVNTYALGQLETVSGEDASYLPALLLALTGPLIIPSILATLIALTDMSKSRQRWAQVSVFAIAALPVLLTIIDVARLQARTGGAALWFTPLGPRYAGGFIERSAYTGGTLSATVNILVYAGLGILLAALALVVLFRGSKSPAWLRNFAALTLVSQFFAILPNIIALPARSALAVNLLASAIYLAPAAISAFRPRTAKTSVEFEPIAGRRSISLQMRLTVLALITTLPLLAATGVLLTNQARGALEQNALATLAAVNRNIADAGEVWLANNTRTLRVLAGNGDIQSMDPARQSPVLRSLTSIYPEIFLASVVDLNGMNTARSDGRAFEEFKDRLWFKQAASGLPVGFEAQASGADGKPTLTAAAPIRNPAGDVIGVVMFSSQLTQIDRLVNAQIAAGATVMIVDEENRLIASSNPQDRLMADLNHLLTVQTLRSGKLGAFRYRDSRGDYWNAHLNVLSNDWGVVVLQSESSLFAPIRNFQRLSAALLAIGALILLWLTWSTIRQAMAPVRELTETAQAISAGDLSRAAPVYEQDELGLLAKVFNHMTEQLRELITGLETRISERTRDLERRAVQLQVTAEVAREAAGIHNPDQLLQDVTRLISERFGHYHAGIFTIQGSDAGSGADAEARPGRYAVLQAASSDGGQRMLKRGHRLAVADRPGAGQGIVGFVAGSGQPRIALDVGREPVYFNNPDLPLTRSEMAVPLKIHDRVIGVLDVQSRKPAAFDDQDLATLQALADQVAVAIENANLIAESQRALNELENLYGLQVQQGWHKRLGDNPLVYRLEAGKVHAQVDPAPGQAMPEADSSVPTPPAGDARLIEMPIELRSARLGLLRLRRGADQEGWTAHDRELAEQAVARLAQALENARLVEEVQNRARQEELINQMVSRTQSTLNLDSVLRTAVEEIVQAVNASRVQIRLRTPGNGDSNGNGTHFDSDKPQEHGSPQVGGQE